MPPCVEVEPQSETASFSAGGGEAGGRVSRVSQFFLSHLSITVVLICCAVALT